MKNLEILEIVNVKGNLGNLARKLSTGTYSETNIQYKTNLKQFVRTYNSLFNFK